MNFRIFAVKLIIMRTFILICLSCFITSTGFSQESLQDSTVKAPLTKKELRRQRVAKRNFHYNILGGPSYTPDFGLLVGGSALMTFRMNP